MLQGNSSRKTVIAVAMVAVALGAVQQASAGLPECNPNPRPRLFQRCQPAPIDRAPTIGGTPASSVTTGQNYSFKPTASDPEGKPLTFSITNQPAWASFSSATGRLSGTPPTAAREGQTYEFRPVATDADGDTLTFSITNKPIWSTFDGATGILKGTPGIGTVGAHPNIAIRVSDGRKSVSLPTFSIGVEQASMGSAMLSWQAPTLRVDGSPLLNLAGYWIRYGTVPGSYPNQVKIANPGITSHVIANLPAGKYYFVATAYGASGRESVFSSTVSKTIG